MTPANPDNSKPFIYRIADALGITHLVVAAQHSHLMSEITGLVDALSAKANASDVQTALEGKQNTLTFDTTPTANSTNPVTSGGVKAALDGKQDALTFDTTPTTSSTNPVTSGGVKTALNGKQDTLTFDTTPTANSTNPVTSGGVKAALDASTNVIETNDIGFDVSKMAKGISYTMLFTNETGETVTLDELINNSNLPVPEKYPYYNVPTESVEIANGGTVLLHIIRTSLGIFIHYDGDFEY